MLWVLKALPEFRDFLDYFGNKSGFYMVKSSLTGFGISVMVLLVFNFWRSSKNTHLGEQICHVGFAFPIRLHAWGFLKVGTESTRTIATTLWYISTIRILSSMDYKKLEDTTPLLIATTFPSQKFPLGLVSPGIKPYLELIRIEKVRNNTTHAQIIY